MSNQGSSSGIRHETLFGDRVVRCFAERPRSLWSLFCAAAETIPEGEALLWEPDGRLTYDELHARAGALSAGLSRCGLQAGDRIATLIGNRPEYVVLALAAWRIGAVLVPLDTRLQTDEIAHILRDSGARMLLCEGVLRAGLPSMDAVPDLTLRLIVDGDITEEERAFEDVAQDGDPVDAAEIGEEDIAAILYTSGTTGVPKGVVLAHVNIVHSTMHFERVWQLPRGSRSLLTIPATNVTGLVAIILTMFRIGGCTVMMPPFKAAEFLRIAEKRRINHSFMVPAQYKLCLMAPGFETHDLSSWRLGSTGGAPMPRAFVEELMRRIPSLQLSDGYGATELASPAIIRPPALTPAHPDSIGLPVACADVIVMQEDGTEAPVGEPGELWIKGPMVCIGYWRNPQATTDGFVDGYWKSGDIASRDAAGLVTLHDRMKDLVNRGGYKIYSAEVEHVLAQHAAVGEVAVIPKPDNVLGERVHAVVHLCAAAEIEELRAFCAARLADYKVPEGFTILAHPLPRNSNGKILKRTLRDQLFPADAPA